MDSIAVVLVKYGVHGAILLSKDSQVLVPEEHIVAYCNGKVFSQTQHQGCRLVNESPGIQEHLKELLCRVRGPEETRCCLPLYGVDLAINQVLSILIKRAVEHPTASYRQGRVGIGVDAFALKALKANQGFARLPHHL
ncbi:hypothetical protein EDD21DRAFT_418025 [Dissophora ornata]|nr:hypothetical protein BGZ58_004997 [Dissophora ornata]KAI8598160.1 hypothetical protein EDD21DRAFT_418025 [Dissophora ornata]